MKRPVTFKDWRALWHYESTDLGWEVAWNWAANGGRIVMTRQLWRLCHRVRRIRMRLDIESKVMDATWCEAMFEILAAEAAAGGDG